MTRLLKLNRPVFRRAQRIIQAWGCQADFDAQCAYFARVSPCRRRGGRVATPLQEGQEEGRPRKT